MKITVQNFLSRSIFVKIYFLRRFKKLVANQDIVGIIFFWEKPAADGTEEKIEALKPRTSFYFSVSLDDDSPVHPAFNFGDLEEKVEFNLKTEKEEIILSLVKLKSAIN